MWWGGFRAAVAMLRGQRRAPDDELAEGEVRRLVQREAPPEERERLRAEAQKLRDEERQAGCRERYQAEAYFCRRRARLLNLAAAPGPSSMRNRLIAELAKD